jgi:hypothetical protein
MGNFLAKKNGGVGDCLSFGVGGANSDFSFSKATGSIERIEEKIHFYQQ